MPSTPASDLYALDSGGQLKDLADIVFYHSETDETPLSRAGEGVLCSGIVFHLNQLSFHVQAAHLAIREDGCRSSWQLSS